MRTSRLADLIAGLHAWPVADGWRRSLLELAWALPLMLIVAHAGALVRLQSPPDAITAAGLAATLFVAPALGEELLFRGLLIPRREPRLLWIVLSTLLLCSGIRFRR